MSNKDAVYLAQPVVAAYWGVASYSAMMRALHRKPRGTFLHLQFRRTFLVWAASFFASWVVAAYSLWRLLV